MKKIITMLLLLFCFYISYAQRISFNAEGYNNVYEAGGVSIGLYFGHYNSMSDTNQDKFMQLMYKDCNTKYIQDYFHDWPSDKEESLKKVAAYYHKAKAYNPDVEFSAVFNGYAKGTCQSMCVKKVIGGKEKWILDIDNDTVYEEMARWYYEMTMALHKLGVKMTVVNVVNEPDFNKKYLYGYGLSNKEGVGRILEKSVPIYRKMMADTLLNPDKIPCPQIMAPSTLDPKKCSGFIDHWKENNKTGWDNVDIVSTHQYANGTNWDAFQQIKKRLDGRRFIQSEQHTNRGGGLGDIEDDLSKQHKAVLSTAVLFFTAVNSGVETWWYFQDNYPQEFHNGGLIRIAWGGEPLPYPQYYAFRQLNSMQPAYSHRLSYKTADISKTRLTAFRHKEDNKIYAHITNLNKGPYEIMLDALQGEKKYGLKGVKVWYTDEEHQIEQIKEQLFTKPVKETKVILPAYSLATVELIVDSSGYTVEPQEQEITFVQIEDKKVGDDKFKLQATSTSELAVEFEVISGPAELEGDSVLVTGAGKVIIRAKQEGNTKFLSASYVEQKFTVLKGSTPSNTYGTIAEGVSIYPNPVSGNSLKISGIEVVRSVEVYNVIGQKQNVSFSENKVNVSKLTGGVYFIRVNDSVFERFLKK